MLRTSGSMDDVVFARNGQTWATKAGYLHLFGQRRTGLRCLCGVSEILALPWGDEPVSMSVRP